MANIQGQSISQEKFLLMSANLLHRTFIEATRTTAKKVYKELSEGSVVGLAKVNMEDSSTAEITLALECSEYRGKLNYSAFRSSLATLIGNITRSLKEQKELKVFSAQHDSTATIFGVTAVTMEGDTTNVMVLAAEADDREGVTRLQLMYLNPGQFSASQDASEPV
jgi:hypothetical protein